jgi:acetyltransferase-like isoleucine patch superfamily enzyme
MPHREPMNLDQFQEMFSRLTDFRANRFHPLVWINGEPEFGQGVYVGGFSEINAKGARIVIGDHCDIASFVSINVADSHKRCLGLGEDIERADIVLEDHVFVGSHVTILGGAHIGHHCVIAAGTVVAKGYIPPGSLVAGNPMTVREGYFRDALERAGIDGGKR